MSLGVVRVLAILLTFIALAPAAHATVYAPMDEAMLTSQSAAIVTGTVTANVVRQDGPRIVTDTTIAVDRVFKGAIDGMTVTITTPGGTIGDTRAVVFGAPRFTEGDQVLVYLQPDAENAVRTTALALGAYRLQTAADGSIVATHALPLSETRPLADVAATTQALADPGSTVGGGSATLGVTEKFTFLGSPPGRWFKADQNQPVRMAVANAEATLGAAGSNSVVDAAMAAWTNVPTASIILERGGSTSPARSAAGGTCDGVNTVQFNDPFGEIAPLNGCFGVLAVGGYCTTGSTGNFDGRTFSRITEGDLTVADGLGACFGITSFEEIVTHEVGHVIGMGHSSSNSNEPDPTLANATMYFLVHLDGRGASLRSDDIAGVSALYPSQVDPNDLDSDGVANADDACPDTPSAIAVDTNGCGCGETGHVACDDGLTCTADDCDAATGRCTAAPVDCTGGDPCLTGACDEATGCSTTDVAGTAAALCVYDRYFPPALCAGGRVPRRIGRLFDQAGRLAARGVTGDDARLLARADHRLARAGRAVDRAALRRRRPLSAPCVSGLDLVLDEARRRLPQ